MADLVEALASWRSFVAVVFVFGFMPGCVLRLLVMIYPSGHPRRRELLAELYNLRRIERPFFVAEQLETALFEAVPARVMGAVRALSRKEYKWWPWTREIIVDTEYLLVFPTSIFRWGRKYRKYKNTTVITKDGKTFLVSRAKHSD